MAEHDDADRVHRSARTRLALPRRASRAVSPTTTRGRSPSRTCAGGCSTGRCSRATSRRPRPLLGDDGVDTLTITDPDRKAMLRPPGALGPDDPGAILGVFKSGYAGPRLHAVAARAGRRDPRRRACDRLGRACCAAARWPGCRSRCPRRSRRPRASRFGPTCWPRRASTARSRRPTGARSSSSSATTPTPSRCASRASRSRCATRATRSSSSPTRARRSRSCTRSPTTSPPRSRS